MKAPDELVKLAIRETLARQKIHSQKELAGVVRRMLRKGNSEYSVSEKRVRRLALLVSGVSLSVKSRKGRMPSACPVCSGELRKVYTHTLHGGRIISELACKACSYRGSGNRWVPRNYEFSLR
ncbi:MAG: hypothetical protein HY518_04745 [Candidatus Aenigmarchaeota archaeon]|nr:hypothetical protein [Candidatus Aenigmarchaeota archaeon]